MDGNIGLMLLLQAALIACNAIFACAEIAVISMSESKLEKLVSDGDKRAKRLQKLTNQTARFLSTIQVAITLAGFLGSAFAAENFSGPIVDALIGAGVTIPEKTLDTFAVIVITLVLSYVTLILGELVPKQVAMRKSEEMALALSTPLYVISRLFGPIVSFLTVSTNAVLRLMGIDPNAHEDEVSEEDIRDMVDSGAKKGTIDDEEREIIENVFEFDDLTAGEIATHRTDVKILWMEEDDEAWSEIIHGSCHMFYPVCDESVDNVIGVLYLKDYFRMKTHDRKSVMEQSVKPAYFVPVSVAADVLFRNMKTQNKSFAIVLDEYGGMHGIITMNDLISRLIGDFSSDNEEAPQRTQIELEQTGENLWTVRGNVSLSDIVRETEAELPVDEVDTFTGMVFSELGSVPDDGEEIIELDAYGLHIRILDIREHQIELAEFSLLDPPTDDDDEDDDDDELFSRKKKNKDEESDERED